MKPMLVALSLLLAARAPAQEEKGKPSAKEKVPAQEEKEKSASKGKEKVSSEEKERQQKPIKKIDVEVVPHVPREEILEFLTKECPQITDELKALREQHPEALEKLARGMSKPLAELEGIKDKAPDLLETQLAAIRTQAVLDVLTMRYHSGDTHVDKDAMRGRLRQAVEQHFDARVALRERELAELENKVKDVRAQLEKQRQNKKALVDQRLNEVTGQKGGLEFP
jgi:hypothetical protein